MVQSLPALAHSSVKWEVWGGPCWLGCAMCLASPAELHTLSEVWTEEPLLTTEVILPSWGPWAVSLNRWHEPSQPGCAHFMGEEPGPEAPRCASADLRCFRIKLLPNPTSVGNLLIAPSVC